ncbi:MAG: polysaccharide biosynthesis protein [Planctomycetota bacterium]|jgi:FlaA1/EpsC-like NDP-sugar epimerase
MLADRSILITGCTGSLGSALLRRALSGADGRPARVVGLSRDEEKQTRLERELRREQERGGGEAIPFELRIGDVRDRGAVLRALRGVDLVLHTAALKQVPICERFPEEAHATNVGGPANIIASVAEHRLEVEAVVSVSTDKACEPTSVLGMTKSLGERMLVAANLDVPRCRFLNVRLGNLLGSRGSVLPLWQEQQARGEPLTVTDPGMTRFLLTIEAAVDAMLFAVDRGGRGETIVAPAPAVRIGDLAEAVASAAGSSISRVGARPGEKRHERLISRHECERTTRRGEYWVIAPDLAGLPAHEGETLSAPLTSDTEPLPPGRILSLIEESRGTRA